MRKTSKTKRFLAQVVTLALGVGMVAATAQTAQAAPAPTGQGFTVTASDLAFILKQIKIAEHHAATYSPADPCGTLVGPGPDQIPDYLTAYGLRTVDGSCNNLVPGREKFAAADVPFPRLTNPVFNAAEPITAALPVGAPGPTSYAQKKGVVIDSQPRVISNLIVDQTSTNPAAVAAAAFPVRTQGNPGLFPCTTDPAPDGTGGIPANCVPSHQSLFIPNVTTDVGLSPPYNSLFTFFGQFFDHGVDQTVKSGGTVFVPLHADDPLVTVGPDGIAGTGDEVPANQAFMVLTRAQNQPGPDGVIGDRSPTTSAAACTSLNVPVGCDESADDVQDANNTDSPWVDQSQTYSSHASHQVFLREYVTNAAGAPVSTGRLLGGLAAGLTYQGSPDGTNGIGTWAAVKLQASTKLGLQLVDTDVTNIPMIAADPYGKFLPGPLRGLPQYVTASGMVEGNLAAPVPVPANVLHFETPFLTDIAHNADPGAVGPCSSPGVPAGCLTPDADLTPSADFAAQPAGTYDDEMLNAHFSCGDGRCNENIALSTIHQVFHSEHDRLVDYMKNVLTTDTTPSGVAALADWQLATTLNPAGWNGERLFQAARFVTEMEYQHLVFEEFARKVQPAVRPFHVYNPDVNPAVDAEFAHAVYRFGHSMLNDDVARTNIDGSDNSVPLLTAFLNPPEYFKDGHGGTLTPEQAAGSIVMGSSDQVGNELDEFVVETLRNNLLGLPLDLPTLNMTRARDAGVPPLNNVRRQIHAATNDGQLAPYTSWSDFGQHLKHPESLINFVAAYGLHPSITAQSTLAGKRAAAKLIVDPANPTDPAIPTDAAEFMFSSGAWANTVDGVTITGLDNVDLWVGGLAEITNLFGGLLGSTFNYVFETQLEKLQDFDRLYYLNRTPGMNLRSQLEGNSFAEMIQRNTDGTNSLKADAFATADCKFQLANLNGTAAGFTSFGSTVADDPATTDCDESKLLLRKPDGTIQYKAVNSVDPVGINGQSVYNGTSGVDRIFGGNDNDTFWGGAGKDIIEGNGGDDVALGGEGSDIITDLGGADVLKGGPGNDALDGGIGDDIFMGGDGQDFINGGANDNEAFAGPGNDFVIAGDGADAVFGDGGDDWIQGGTGQDLLIGDHSAPFFDDPAQVAPGNDIFIGQPGENDYDAEGGDDIMSQNAAVDRNAGAGGFDWAIHQYDTVGANDDMEINNNLVGVPIQIVVNRDRWQETEANSGSAFNDVIKGTSVAPAAIGGAGFTGCDALDAAGVARIAGLNALVTTFPSPLAPIVAASAPKACPLVGTSLDGTTTGDNVWGEGDILIGGLGSDTITGRGANDIIDGDRYLRVRISVKANADGTGAEIGSTDLMEHPYLTGSTHTLQQDVFAGLVDPGQLVAVREIITPTAAQTAGNVDTAVFAGPVANYDINSSVPGVVTVTQTGANVVGQKVSDGIDTLTNIEALQFSDGTVSLAVPGTPTITSVVAGSGNAAVTFTVPPASLALTSFTLRAVAVGTGAVVTETFVDTSLFTQVLNGLTNGTQYNLSVAATNAVGTSAPSASFGPVTPVAPPVLTAPGAPIIGTAVAGNASATVDWSLGTNGGSPITGYSVQAFAAGVPVGLPQPAAAGATSLTVTGLTNGTAYQFTVKAINAIGTGPASALSDPVTPATSPGAPTIGAATRGDSSATATWTAPATNGGSPITSYTVQTFIGGVASGAPVPAAAGTTSLLVTGLTNGTPVQFQVTATNLLGNSAPSGLSAAVTPATTPGTPTIGAVTRGNASATVNWTAPPSNGGSAITGYSVRVVGVVSGLQVGGLRTAGAAATSLVVTALTNGTAYRFQVRANNAVGAGLYSAFSASVTPAAPATVPVIAAAPTVVRGNTVATVSWVSSSGGSAITGSTVQIVNAAGTQVGGLRAAAAGATSLVVTGLTNGTAYRARVRATNAIGTGAFSPLSLAFTPATVPNAPVIGTATSGVAGGTVTATAAWAGSTVTGGSAITGYRVSALRLSAAGVVLATTTSALVGSTVRSLVMPLAAGNYRFTVVAVNAVGSSAASARSNQVTAR